MTNLDLCSWLQFENRNFVPEGVFRWDFVHFRYVASCDVIKSRGGGGGGGGGGGALKTNECSRPLLLD